MAGTVFVSQITVVITHRAVGLPRILFFLTEAETSLPSLLLPSLFLPPPFFFFPVPYFLPLLPCRSSFLSHPLLSSPSEKCLFWEWLLLPPFSIRLPSSLLPRGPLIQLGIWEAL